MNERKILLIVRCPSVKSQCVCPETGGSGQGRRQKIFQGWGATKKKRKLAKNTEK